MHGGFVRLCAMQTSRIALLAAPLVLASCASAPVKILLEHATPADHLIQAGEEHFARLDAWVLPMPYARVDWRDAFHRDGQSFVYVSDLVRVTGGLRLDLGRYVILKAEYTYNHELDRIPQFANDVLTTSALVVY